MSIVAWMDRTFYPKYADNWDDKLFRDRIVAHLDPEKTVLDLGAGAGLVEEMNFKGLAKRICGVDLDPRVRQNPYLDDAKVADAENIPYDDCSFDLIFSDNVMEHIDNADRVFSEIYRLLRPGGYFMFKTPNKYHYMPMISRITPYGFHRFYNRLRGREGEDTFPTLYRVNCRKDVEALAAKHAFDIERLERIEGRPEYLRINCIPYAFGLLYERMVNSSDLFAPFRILLMATLRKPA